MHLLFFLLLLAHYGQSLPSAPAPVPRSVQDPSVQDISVQTISSAQYSNSDQAPNSEQAPETLEVLGTIEVLNSVQTLESIQASNSTDDFNSTEPTRTAVTRIVNQYPRNNDENAYESIDLRTCSVDACFAQQSCVNAATGDSSAPENLTLVDYKLESYCRRGIKIMKISYFGLHVVALWPGIGVVMSVYGQTEQGKKLLFQCASGGNGRPRSRPSIQDPVNFRMVRLVGEKVVPLKTTYCNFALTSQMPIGTYMKQNGYVHLCAEVTVDGKTSGACMKPTSEELTKYFQRILYLHPYFMAVRRMCEIASYTMGALCLVTGCILVLSWRDGHQNLRLKQLEQARAQLEPAPVPIPIRKFPRPVGRRRISRSTKRSSVEPRKARKASQKSTR